jgi:ABC-type transport system involved in multi-copper enzyme maturation permease subunit
MLGVVHGELIKLRHRPAVGVIVVLSACFLVLSEYVLPGITYYLVIHGDLQPDWPINQMRAALLPDQLIQTVMEAVSFDATFLAFILGVLLAGSEYGWGTYKLLLTVGPSRAAVYAGQVVGIGVAAAAMITALVVTGTGAVLVGARLLGEAGTWPALLTVGQAWVVGWLILATWSVLGFLLGSLVRSAPLAIGVGFIWFLVIENLLQLFALRFHAVEVVEQWLPWANTITLGGIYGAAGASGPLLWPVHSGDHYLWVPEVYLLGALALGCLVLVKRDIR